jgi:DNA-binding HxlR family transcriptional regulator
MEVTLSAQQAPRGAETCDVREVLDVVSDKWSLYVVANLAVARAASPSSSARSTV